MKVEFDSKFVDDLKKIKKSDPKLFKLILRKISYFRQNQNHTSLKLHKLSGCLKNAWSISINRSIRTVFYYKKKNMVCFVAVGKHDQVYRN